MSDLTRILLILSSVSTLFGQTAEELKRFMDTYGKIKVDQQANEVVRKGIESEKDPEEGPVRLLVNPKDISEYYYQKMHVIRKDLDQLNRMLIYQDSIPPIDHFGYNYFSLRDSIQFIDNANVGKDYILGYGDEVVISIWGQAEQHERKTLDRDGTIFVENVGLLYLGGKNQSQAKSYVFDRFSKVYATLNSNPRLTNLEFSIGKIKNINISVSGHVKYPGNYVVNPSISIPNVLILAGGVNSNGTLRNIYVQRGDAFVDTLDLYPLITGFGLIDQVPIFEGDIIVVPSRRETVAVTGDILNPAYFEIKSKESISTVLQYAGIKKFKLDQNVIIARSQSSSLYLTHSELENNHLINGDSLIVPKSYNLVKSISVSTANHNYIEIPWFESLSFSQILSIININKNNVRSVELIRRNINNNKQEILPFTIKESTNFKFFPSDHLSIHLFDIFSPTKTVVVKGEVLSPGTYPLINNQESLSSIINRAGGLQGTSSIGNVLVKRDTLVFGSVDGELILSPGDSIIAKPHLGTVKVEGEVHNPGNFEWNKGFVAKNYLMHAGGLTAYGDKKHIVYITPYGRASRINQRSNVSILPGSVIRVSERPLFEQNGNQQFYQQINTIISSLISIAILANTSK